jgi:hypothetical protein
MGTCLWCSLLLKMVARTTQVYVQRLSLAVICTCSNGCGLVDVHGMRKFAQKLLQNGVWRSSVTSVSDIR